MPGGDHRACVSLLQAFLLLLLSINSGGTNAQEISSDGYHFSPELIMRAGNFCLLLLFLCDLLFYFIACLLTARCVSRGQNQVF